MSKPPTIHLERLPKRDAVARLRAAYACLERGWRARLPVPARQTGRRAADRQTESKSTQEEVT
ncbi:MAG: hypothetical protein MAG451_00553 [Anaerolineales bacterium]|nr:hypothetical protein [Anaerolineales bacterium]